MTLKEFRLLLNENPELHQKVRQAVEAKADKFKSNAAACWAEIAAEFGYQIPESEFVLEQISQNELDEAELEKVAGGQSHPGICSQQYLCEYDYTDTDCSKHDYCDFMNLYYDCSLLYRDKETGSHFDAS